MTPKNVVAAVVCSLVLSGCATSVPLAEKSARMTIDKLFVAQKAGDVDGSMTLFSDRYSDEQGANKAMVRQFLGGLIYQNAFADVSMNLENAFVSIDDGAVTIAPVGYSGPTGISLWSFTLEREDDGIWRVVSSRQLPAAP